VRTVNLAGDALGAAVLASLAATPTVARVCNHYGPSETTTYSTGTSLLERDDALSARAPAPLVAAADQPPIGGPIANTRVDVLDEWLAPLPIGVVGEICIAGDGVARGYAGRPALTAARFVPDRTGGGAGARMYRTGDLGRWRPDGQLEFLGRNDRQLKVRGFRVEPDEVEAVLGADASVLLAAVALRDLPGRGPSLVAWYSSRVEMPEREQSDALRAACRAALPEHMVPAAFVRLSRLPRTAMGKIDARILPDPPAQRSVPRTRRAPDPGLDLLPPSAR
jgi:acyl-coenzyme A synthetase/AMP-(fatty) acid ligase